MLLDNTEISLRPNLKEIRLDEVQITDTHYICTHCSSNKSWFVLRENNPVGKDKDGVFIYAVSSIKDIPSSAFIKPTTSILLPPPPMAIAKAMRVPARAFLIKQRVFIKNLASHPEIKTVRANKKILELALYNSNIVIYNRPVTRPTYRMVAKVKDYVYLANIDTATSNPYFEVVDWRMVDLEELGRMASFEGSQGYVAYLKSKFW